MEPPSKGDVRKLQPLLRESVFYKMVGRSIAMKELFRRVGDLSGRDSHILIEGDRGTGKKLVAHAIHQISGGDGDSIVSMNCSAALNDWGKDRFEEIILDPMKSLEQSVFGVIFLEGIDSLPLDFQEKLLEALRKKPAGGIRLMASIGLEPEDKVAAGKLNEDLFRYFRVGRIRVPSLNERKEDISLLLAHFFEKYSEEQGGVQIEEEAYNRLLSHEWPGNVRELENLVEQWVETSCGEIVGIDDLPEKFFQKIDRILLPPDGIDLKGILSEIEESLIGQALKITGDNKNKASKLLRINRTTLIEKMKKKGLLKTNQD